MLLYVLALEDGQQRDQNVISRSRSGERETVNHYITARIISAKFKLREVDSLTR